MGIEIPGEVQWLADKVVGTNWPEGDETALRRLADLWEDAAQAVDEVAKDGDAAATAALAGMKGKSADAFQQRWRSFTAGDDADLPKLSELCRAIAEACRKSATSIEYTKLSIIAALIVLAAQIAAMIASAVASLGSSTTGIPIAMAITRGVVMKIVMEALKQVAFNVGINLTIDLGIQAYQAGRGNRDEWDAGKTGKAVQAGAIAGLAGGAVRAGGTAASIRAAGANAGKFGRVVDGAADDAAEAGSRPLARGVDAMIGVNSAGFTSAAVKGATAGAVAGSTANVTNDFVNGKRGSELFGSAIAGASAGAVGGSLDGMTTRHGGLVESFYQGGARGQGPEFRVTEASPQNQNRAEGGGWNSSRAQHVEGPPPNSGNDEYDGYPGARSR